MVQRRGCNLFPHAAPVVLEEDTAAPTVDQQLPPNPRVIEGIQVMGEFAAITEGVETAEHVAFHPRVVEVVLLQQVQDIEGIVVSWIAPAEVEILGVARNGMVDPVAPP